MTLIWARRPILRCRPWRNRDINSEQRPRKFYWTAYEAIEVRRNILSWILLCICEIRQRLRHCGSQFSAARTGVGIIEWRGILKRFIDMVNKVAIHSAGGWSVRTLKWQSFHELR